MKEWIIKNNDELLTSETQEIIIVLTKVALNPATFPPETTTHDELSDIRAISTSRKGSIMNCDSLKWLHLNNWLH